MNTVKLKEIWIGRGEACRQLGISSPTLTEMVDAGRIGVLAIPGLSRRRYRRSDVEAILAQSVTPARADRQLIEA